MNSMMNDSLTGIRVVKAFAKEDAETHRFYEYSSRLYKANRRSMPYPSGYSLLSRS